MWTRAPGIICCFALLFLALLSRTSFGLDISKPNFYRHNVWTAEDGLPMNNVLSIQRTPDGYLWLATETGLARFDGLEFDVFNSENTPALSDDLIQKLLVDRNGALWMAGRGGGVFRCFKGKYQHYTTDSGLLSNEVWALTETGDGSIFIGSTGGLNRFYQGIITAVPMPPAVTNHDIKALLEDRIGRIWVGTRGNGIVLVNKRNQEYETSRHSNLTNLKVFSLLEDRGGTIWLGTMEKGLIGVRGDDKIVFDITSGLANNWVKALFEDSEGNMWVGVEGGGIHVLPMGSRQIVTFDFHENLTGQSIQAFYEDDERTLWIGTEGGGLHSLRNTKIAAYTKQNGLSSENIYGVFQNSRGVIWAGTKGGGANYLEGNRFKALTVADGLSHNSVLTFAENPAGTMWLGTQGGGVNRLENGKITVFDNRRGLGDHFIRALYTDPDGTLWAGSDSGLLYFLEGEGFVLFRNLKSRITAIYKDKNGSLWVGTSAYGLFRIKGREFENFTTSNGLAGDRLCGISEDHEGYLWVGTYGGGIACLKDNRFITISKENGLPDNVVYCLLRDGKKNLWMSSNLGIFVVKRRQLTDFLNGTLKRLSPAVYGVDDGMPDLECNGGNQPAGRRSADGKLWFPTTRGLAVVDPGNMGINKRMPPVVIKAFSWKNEPYMDVVSVSEIRKPVVPAGEGNLKIRYTALSFIMSKNIRFRCRLEGKDRKWREMGRLRTAVYNDLSPGNYRFRVTACNSDGVWNDTGAALSLRIAPLFHQTIPFRLLILAGLLAVGGLSYVLAKLYRQGDKCKYKRSSLKVDEADSLIEKIDYLMDMEKVYLNPDISLRWMAKKLKISQRCLSQVLNEKLKRSFYELINRSRVEEARRLLAAPGGNRKSVLEIGFEAGFNSKTAFNRAFKQFAQMTPSQFRKKCNIKL
ncbi:MAG: helix-turn-helix domain-containing protein [bacterium]|nr:helix-turn-helix domain-containing protein [bacterium]